MRNIEKRGITKHAQTDTAESEQIEYIQANRCQYIQSKTTSIIWMQINVNNNLPSVSFCASRKQTENRFSVLIEIHLF